MPSPTGGSTPIPVVEADNSASGAEKGTLADVVTRYGAWADHDAIVCGSPVIIWAPPGPASAGPRTGSGTTRSQCTDGSAGQAGPSIAAEKRPRKRR
jgi:hypothetical protein